MLAAIETALGLDVGTLADERAVLRQHGNMSSPSVLFVLDHALARGARGPAVLAALGPGFTASFVAAELGPVAGGERRQEVGEEVLEEVLEETGNG